MQGFENSKNSSCSRYAFIECSELKSAKIDKNAFHPKKDYENLLKKS